MVKKGKKRGPLSRTDKLYIEAEMGGASPTAIAEALDRPVERILEHIATVKSPHLGRPAATTIKTEDDAVAAIRAELRASSAWRLMSAEFEPQEIALLEEKYIALKLQFKDDVEATEEGQIMKAIKIEVLMHRCFAQQKIIKVELDRLEGLRLAWHEAHPPGGPKPTKEQQNEFLYIENLLASAQAKKQSQTNELMKLEESHQQLMKDLKGTRNQRILKVESSKKTFLDLIRELADHDKAEAEGRMMEMARLAANKERGRLGSEHVYGDNTVDRPLLNAETVMQDSEADENNE